METFSGGPEVSGTIIREWSLIGAGVVVVAEVVVVGDVSSFAWNVQRPIFWNLEGPRSRKLTFPPTVP